MCTSSYRGRCFIAGSCCLGQLKQVAPQHAIWMAIRACAPSCASVLAKYSITMIDDCEIGWDLARRVHESLSTASREMTVFACCAGPGLPTLVSEVYRHKLQASNCAHTQNVLEDTQTLSVVMSWW